jgi:hypothetical protein
LISAWATDSAVSSPGDSPSGGIGEGAVAAVAFDRVVGAAEEHRDIAGDVPATAGYQRPSPQLDRGYGLWIIRQLADVVTTYCDGSGTTIALDFPLVVRP